MSAANMTVMNHWQAGLLVIPLTVLTSGAAASEPSTTNPLSDELRSDYRSVRDYVLRKPG